MTIEGEQQAHSLRDRLQCAGDVPRFVPSKGKNVTGRPHQGWPSSETVLGIVTVSESKTLSDSRQDLNSLSH